MLKFTPELTPDGRIPAGQECPFKNKCLDKLVSSSMCKHQGINHKTEFSCATARLIKLVENNNA